MSNPSPTDEIREMFERILANPKFKELQKLATQVLGEPGAKQTPVETSTKACVVITGDLFGGITGVYGPYPDAVAAAETAIRQIGGSNGKDWLVVDLVPIEEAS